MIGTVIADSCREGGMSMDIAFDKVYLWHGELDENVAISMGRSMAEIIPNCRAKFYPEDAHLSLPF